MSRRSSVNIVATPLLSSPEFIALDDFLPVSDEWLSQQTIVDMVKWSIKFVDSDTGVILVKLIGTKFEKKTGVIRPWESSSLRKSISPDIVESVTGSFYRVGKFSPQNFSNYPLHPDVAKILSVSGFPSNWPQFLAFMLDRRQDMLPSRRQALVKDSISGAALKEQIIKTPNSGWNVISGNDSPVSSPSKRPLSDRKRLSLSREASSDLSSANTSPHRVNRRLDLGDLHHPESSLYRHHSLKPAESSSSASSKPKSMPAAPPVAASKPSVKRPKDARSEYLDGLLDGAHAPQTKKPKTKESSAPSEPHLPRYKSSSATTSNGTHHPHRREFKAPEPIPADKRDPTHASSFKSLFASSGPVTKRASLERPPSSQRLAAPPSLSKVLSDDDLVFQELFAEPDLAMPVISSSASKRHSSSKSASSSSLFTSPLPQMRLDDRTSSTRLPLRSSPTTRHLATSSIDSPEDNTRASNRTAELLAKYDRLVNNSPSKFRAPSQPPSKSITSSSASSASTSKLEHESSHRRSFQATSTSASEETPSTGDVAPSDVLYSRSSPSRSTVEPKIKSSPQVANSKLEAPLEHSHSLTQNASSSAAHSLHKFNETTMERSPSKEASAMDIDEPSKDTSGPASLESSLSATEPLPHATDTLPTSYDTNPNDASLERSPTMEPSALVDEPIQSSPRPASPTSPLAATGPLPPNIKDEEPIFERSPTKSYPIITGDSIKSSQSSSRPASPTSPLTATEPLPSESKDEEPTFERSPTKSSPTNIGESIKSSSHPASPTSPTSPLAARSPLSSEPKDQEPTFERSPTKSSTINIGESIKSSWHPASPSSPSSPLAARSPPPSEPQDEEPNFEISPTKSSSVVIGESVKRASLPSSPSSPMSHLAVSDPHPSEPKGDDPILGKSPTKSSAMDVDEPTSRPTPPASPLTSIEPLPSATAASPFKEPLPVSPQRPTRPRLTSPRPTPNIVTAPAHFITNSNAPPTPSKTMTRLRTANAAKAAAALAKTVTVANTEAKTEAGSTTTPRTASGAKAVRAKPTKSAKATAKPTAKSASAAKSTSSKVAPTTVAPKSEVEPSVQSKPFVPSEPPKKPTKDAWTPEQLSLLQDALAVADPTSITYLTDIVSKVPGKTVEQVKARLAHSRDVKGDFGKKTEVKRASSAAAPLSPLKVDDDMTKKKNRKKLELALAEDMQAYQNDAFEDSKFAPRTELVLVKKSGALKETVESTSELPCEATSEPNSSKKRTGAKKAKSTSKATSKATAVPSFLDSSGDASEELEESDEFLKAKVDDVQLERYRQRKSKVRLTSTAAVSSQTRKHISEISRGTMLLEYMARGAQRAKEAQDERDEIYDEDGIVADYASGEE